MNATASSFSMTVILNSPQMQKKKKSGILSDMDWPPHSPDYNITEAVWDQTENRKKNNYQPKNSFECFSRSLANYS